MTFEIRAADGEKVVGHSNYLLQRDHDGWMLRGENRYLNGEYDIETSHIELRGGQRIPTLASFDHAFFSAGRSLKYHGHADLHRRKGTCTRYVSNHRRVTERRIRFPPNTWAGASVLIPVQRIAQGDGTPAVLHAFVCAPDPQVLRLEVSRDGTTAKWPYSDDRIMGIKLRPRLGWWDFAISLWIPKLKVWFDPQDGWAIMGARFVRYFRGPVVTLIRLPAHAGGDGAQ